MSETEPVKIILKKDAQPSAVTVASRVPIPMLPKVKDELERRKSAGVIEEITKPTPWCAPMVPVLKKSGAVRICVDLKRLNLSVERERYIITNATGFDLNINRGNLVHVSRCRFGVLPNPATRSQSRIDDIHHADGSLLLSSPPIRNHVCTTDIHAENELTSSWPRRCVHVHGRHSDLRTRKSGTR